MKKTWMFFGLAAAWLAAGGPEGRGAQTVITNQVRSLAPDALPRIVSTHPTNGAVEVDPKLGEITVTFDRDMAPGYSWAGGGPDFPALTNATPVWKDQRTCALPVKLEAGHFYRIGVNAPTHQNFRALDGMPVRPTAFFFTTQGASEEVRARALKPVIVAMEPKNGATGVDPGLKEIRVTFSVPMSGGASWMGKGGPQFPPMPEGPIAKWSEDHKTAILAVELKGGQEYLLGLNSVTRTGFQTVHGVPLDPVVYTFTTGP